MPKGKKNSCAELFAVVTFMCFILLPVVPAHLELSDLHSSVPSQSKKEQKTEKVIKHPDETETYEISLTFPLNLPSQKIFSTVSKIILDKAVSRIAFQNYDTKNINPDDFIYRISVKRKEPKADGIEYTFVASVNLRKLLLFIATGEKHYSVNLTNCSLVYPSIARALLERTAHANILCYVSFMKEKSGIKTLKVEMNGTLGKDKSPFRFRRTYHFFSVFPYEQMYNDIVKILEETLPEKVFKITEQTFSVKSTMVVPLMNSLSSKAYFLSVIPFDVVKENGKHKLRIYLISPRIVPDDYISDLLLREAEKFKATIETDDKKLT